MHTLLIVLHVIFCVFLILVILLQTGKGAGIGASFGGGSSQTVFGPRGAGSFIGKLTGVVATLFMLTSLTLAYLSSSTATGLAAKVEARGLEEQARNSQDVDLQDLVTQTTDEEATATDAGTDLDTSTVDEGTVTDLDTTSAEPVDEDAEAADAAADAKEAKPEAEKATNKPSKAAGKGKAANKEKAVAKNKAANKEKAAGKGKAANKEEAAAKDKAAAKVKPAKQLEEPKTAEKKKAGEPEAATAQPKADDSAE